MSLQFIQLLYLLSAICFILSLKFLFSRKWAVIGGRVGTIGIIIAIFSTFYLPNFTNKTPIIVTMLVGGFLGVIVANRVAMPSMPQLVVGFHSFVGLASLLISYSIMISPENFSLGISGHLSLAQLIEISISSSLGAITFSGSIIACMKLQGMLRVNVWKFYAQRYVGLLSLVLLITLIIFFINLESMLLFNFIVLLSLLVGWWLIIFVSDVDMPVLVSILNSYSGFAVASVGFALSNSLLIIAGALVGSSGAIVSYIMCKSMNKSLAQFILGIFTASPIFNKDIDDYKTIKTTYAKEAAILLKNASSVVIVPGYGMAVAQAQYVVREILDILDSLGVKVRFAIHPVAGRMPGHMNILLANASIEYDKVLDLEKINSDFIMTDVVLVIGANDIINPAAKDDPNSSIYGMQILEVGKAKTVLCIKRSMNPGYVGIANKLFYYDNTLMLFGDAKKVVEEILYNLNGD